MVSNKFWSRCALATVLFIGLFGICQTSFAQSNGVHLEWKWKSGDKIVVESEQDISTSMNLGGQDIATNNTTRTWMTWEVSEVDSDGTGVVNSVIDRMTVEGVSPMGKMKFDSDEDNDDAGPQVEAVAGNLRPMIGAVTTQKINSNGEVLEVSFDDGLKESLMKIGGETTVKMFENVSKNATLSFPEEPLKVGDTWEKQIVTESPTGDVTLTSSYTYKGEETVESKLLHKFDVDVKMEFATEIITIDKQETTGHLYFDAEAGRINHSRVEQDIEMTISQGGQELKQQMKQIAVITLKPAK